MSTTVFVYGTLKRGGRNHHLLAGQEFLGEARTLPRYRLYDKGPYPCLVEEPGHGRAVEGELWRVDEPTLARLDRLEGAPNLFDRRAVSLEGFTGPVVTYVYQGDVSRMKDGGPRWPG